MRSRASSSSRRTGIALAVAAALAAAPAAGQGVRPAVMVDVRIDGELYRSRLGDPACTSRCAQLRTALVDSVRLAFEQSFGFLDWRAAPAAAPDTLRVAWVNNRVTQKGELALTLLGRDVRARARPRLVPFERFSEILDRPPADWQRPEAVRAAWLARLRDILARPSEAQAITRDVLSRVPLRPLVTLVATPDVLVGVGPGALRADPARSPRFLVRMHVVDPASAPPDEARRDTTEMSLVGCSRTDDGSRYRCRVDFLAFPARTPPDTLRGTTDLASLARRARQQPVTLHLWTFFPEPADDAPIRRPEE